MLRFQRGEFSLTKEIFHLGKFTIRDIHGELRTHILPFYEIIVTYLVSNNFLENAQKVGMVILLALMVFAIGNDILKLFS